MAPPKSDVQLPFGILVPERSSVDASSAAPEPWPRLTLPHAVSKETSSQRSAQVTVSPSAPLLGSLKVTLSDGLDFISVSSRAPTLSPGIACALALMPKRVLLG